MPPKFKILKIVCKLKKVIFRLKQSARFWYERFLGFFFEKLGLSKLYANYRIFATQDRFKKLIISSFVDNLNIMTRKRLGLATKIKNKLKAAFNIVDMGSISYYLELKIK